MYIYIHIHILYIYMYILYVTLLVLRNEGIKKQSLWPPFTWLGKLIGFKATSHTLPSIHVTQLPALGVPTFGKAKFQSLLNWQSVFCWLPSVPTSYLEKVL